jgi:hypothetical protein
MRKRTAPRDAGLRDPHDWPSEAALIAGEVPDGAIVARTMLDAGILPIAGGSADPAPLEPEPAEWRAACEMFRYEPAPYVPTAEDLAEMHAHRDATECLHGYE